MRVPIAGWREGGGWDGREVGRALQGSERRESITPTRAPGPVKALRTWKMPPKRPRLTLPVRTSPVMRSEDSEGGGPGRGPCTRAPMRPRVAAWRKYSTEVFFLKHAPLCQHPGDRCEEATSLARDERRPGLGFSWRQGGREGGGGRGNAPVDKGGG